MSSTKLSKLAKSSKSSKLDNITKTGSKSTTDEKSTTAEKHVPPDKHYQSEKHYHSQHQYNHNRRIMTSAIDSMSVAEVRKFLGECRRKYQTQTPNDPMYITDNLPNGMQLQEFALKFQQGHHQKRHNKNWKNKPDGTSSDEEDDDYYDTFNSSENGSDDENIIHTPESQSTIESIRHETKQSQVTQNTSEQNSISNDISSVLVKKRGRPKKNTSPVIEKNHNTNTSSTDPNSKLTSTSQNIKQKHNESHSRSLLDYVKKPSKRTKH